VLEKFTTIASSVVNRTIVTKVTLLSDQLSSERRIVLCVFLQLRHSGERGISDETVAIVIEGGQETFESAYDANKAGIPLLVLAGTGKAADFIAAAHDKREQPLVFPQ